MQMATCHSDRVAMAKGLCCSCYKRENRHKWNIGSKGRKATCHTDRRHYSLGLCKPCYIKQYLANNPERVARYGETYNQKQQGYYLKHKFGLTVEKYEEMFRAQNGLCAICKKPENGNRNLSVDHNHAAGDIRGLLCQRCNTIVGMAKEKTETLASAIAYLESYKEK